MINKIKFSIKMMKNKIERLRNTDDKMEEKINDIEERSLGVMSLDFFP